MQLANKKIKCADNNVLDLSHPQVMGVLNITPDSFVDGGCYVHLDKAIARAAQMIVEGVAIIDVGGESTRPGAAPVSVTEELDRVIPVIEALHREFSIPLSIDTSQPEVMSAAMAAGAGFVNDIRALQVPGAMDIIAQSDATVCLMHMQDAPATMQNDPHYQNVVQEVIDFLSERCRACEQAGIAKERIIVDPGFGFGKTLAHNIQLLKSLDQLQSLGCPVLVGLSRKAMIGAALGLPVSDRLYSSLALAVLAVQGGASIVRTHDVKPTVEAIAMAKIILESSDHVSAA